MALGNEYHHMDELLQIGHEEKKHLKWSELVMHYPPHLSVEGRWSLRSTRVFGGKIVTVGVSVVPTLTM